MSPIPPFPPFQWPIHHFTYYLLILFKYRRKVALEKQIERVQYRTK